MGLKVLLKCIDSPEIGEPIQKLRFEMLVELEDVQF
jgi:hypothetical protein